MSWFRRKKTEAKPKPRQSKKVKGFKATVAAGLLVIAPVTAHQEGTSLVPYLDGGGIETWCTGETEVGRKEHFTAKECEKLFVMRLGFYSLRTSTFYNDQAKAVLTPNIHGAMVDMSYNVGLPTVKKSGMIRNLNAGKPVAACKYILKYKYAAGQDCSLPSNRTCSGVWKRRKTVTMLCMDGLSDENI